MDEELTDEIARLAYKLLLGRPVESEDMLRFARGYGTLGRLRDALLNSREFEYILNLRPRLVPPGAPPMRIDWHTDDAGARAMLAEVGAAWDGVPTADRDGSREAADIAACLLRAGGPPPDDAHAFELGCGAGRVTRHLAKLVGTLTASDASPVQLAAAQRMADSAGLANVGFRAADDLGFGMAEPFDLWYSYHALHHCPPPLAARVLARAFALLRPGGVAIFQTATYGMGYTYTAADTARPRAADPREDKQVLPQPVIFHLAAEAGCDPIEVIEELSVAPSALWRSSLFVLRKRPA